MRFCEKYVFKEDYDKEKKKEVYEKFCVSFVNNVKKILNYTEDETKAKEIIFSIDIPKVRNKLGKINHGIHERKTIFQIQAEIKDIK